MGARHWKFVFPAVEVKISAKRRQMTDGVGKVHDAGIFSSGPVKGDDRDILLFEGRPYESAKHRFGPHFDERAHAGVVKVFYRL